MSAQAISVVAQTGMRPTAILGRHVSYVVATDSLDQRAVLRDVAIGPVGFAGEIHIEGARPGEGRLSRGFADTVRFETDGRVVLRLADERTRPSLAVEVVGSRTAQAARLLISAREWPLGRALIVTIAPADIFEAFRKGTGFGVRDRIRVDAGAGYAFLTDSSAGTTTVAIGLGRGARGRIQSEAADLIIERDFGGQTGRERRTLGALTLIIEPTRELSGFFRAEVLFGVGESEPDAMHAARVGADDPPSLTPAVPLRVSTPLPNVNLLASHILIGAAGAFEWQNLSGHRVIPAAARNPVVTAGWARIGAVAATQRGDSSSVCGSYRLLRRTATEDGTPREISLRLTRQGPGATAQDAEGGDAAMILLAHDCYLAGRDVEWLRGERGWLFAAATRAIAQRDTLAADALETLAELEDELARTRPPSRGDSLRAVAAEARRGEGEEPPITMRWSRFAAAVTRGISQDYGRLSAPGEGGGLSLVAAGAWLDVLGRDLFGIEERIDGVVFAPALDGIADDFTWQIDGWQLSRDVVGMTYRPADRSATIRIASLRRTRLLLAFPWLTPRSCVRARRGSVHEQLLLTTMTDASAYVDLRAHFEPAEVTVLVSPCST